MALRFAIASLQFGMSVFSTATFFSHDDFEEGSQQLTSISSQIVKNQKYYKYI